MKISYVPTSVQFALFGLFFAFVPCPTDAAESDLFSQTGVDLGVAGRSRQWAILTLGSGLNGGLDITAPKGFLGNAVAGQVGVAGSGSYLSLSGQGNIFGNAFVTTSNTLAQSGSGALNGSMWQDSACDDLLSLAAIHANNAKSEAANLAATAGSPTSIVAGRGRNLSFSSAGTYVMQLTDFVVSGGSTITLNGAAGSAFVLNISGNFNIGGGSKILLTGGLRASDVLFNITGTSQSLTRLISGDSTFNGTILATNSTVTLTGRNTKVQGSIIAQRVVLQSGSQVINNAVANPPPVSP